MRAYVLCGGFGTRLQSVTQGTQKALVDVHGEPFLARVLRQLAGAGIQEAVLCAHYRADQVATQLGVLAADTGLHLELVVEAQPLGTGGALLNALREQAPVDRYMVLNADTYLDAAGYQQVTGTTGNALLAVEVSDRSRYGSLAIDADGNLIAMQEKGLAGAGLINAGVYVFNVDAFVACPVRTCSLESDLLPALLAKGKVAVTAYSGRFIDIGTPESFSRYTNDFLTDASR